MAHKHHTQQARQPVEQPAEADSAYRGLTKPTYKMPPKLQRYEMIGGGGNGFAMPTAIIAKR